MKDTLEKIEEKIEDLKARRSTLAAQVRKARETPDDVSQGRYGSSSFDELERMSARIDQLDSEVEAGAVLDDPSRVEVEARFRKLEKTVEGGAVDDELAELKRRLES
jgi:phage shock protein A